MMRPISLVPLLASLTLGGCAHHGPDALRATRAEYNLAIQTSNDQDMLLNLVRLRYRDSLYFMNVERVVSGIELNRSLSAGAVMPSGGNDSYSLGGGIAFNEKPTVFYAPLEGERFVRQMMTPYDPGLLALLANSGWSIERAFRIMLLEMNGLRNAPTASGPTPALEPDYRDFVEAARLMRVLQARGALELGRAPGDGALLELRIVGAGAGVEADRLRALLRLDPGRERYRVEIGRGAAGDGSTLRVVPRSLLASMSYLAQSVEPPPAHAESGLITRTRTASGATFDWLRLFDGFLHVRAAQRQPAEAAVAVRYRDHWYFISDDDLESKSTFALLTQLFALQAGVKAAGGLSLSFPVGG